MTRTELEERIRNLKGKRDLLTLLEALHRADLEEACDTSDTKYPNGLERCKTKEGEANGTYWSMQELCRYAKPWGLRRYRSYSIPKKSGGTRTICVPVSRKYKELLRYIGRLLNALYEPTPCVMGFTQGRSVVDNARIHLGQKYVYNIDLRDFFPSITESRVRARLMAKPYSLHPDVAKTIAGLATNRVRKSSILEDNLVKVSYELPQGSPISPILTNMICERLDRRLEGLAKRFQLRYSRYADDITFSSMHYVYHVGGEFDCELRRIIGLEGFVINEKKVRLQCLGSRQEVTGLIVGGKVNVPQSYVRSLRNILYIWEHYGYEEAVNNFLSNYVVSKCYHKSRKGMPEMERVVCGRLCFLKMVKGEYDSVYVRLQSKFDRLYAALKGESETPAVGRVHSGLNDLEALSLTLEELLS